MVTQLVVICPTPTDRICGKTTPMRPHLVLPLLLASSSLFAQPLITGISPTEGPTSGGTEVTITGVGFAAETSGGVSFGPEVYFGDLRARSETLVDSTTIIATTPAHVSGPVAVRVKKISGTSIATDRFKYVGGDQVAVKRFLIPIFVPPIPGAYGSEFRSELWVSNPGPWVATLDGLFEESGVICPLCPAKPLVVEPGTVVRPTPPRTVTGGPFRPRGLFIDVPSDPARVMAMNLRVYDTSRASTNFGTEIPIVPVSAFRNQVDLLGVPTDPRFRLRLRVYGDMDGFVEVKFGNERLPLSLVSASTDPHDPSYAEVVLPQPLQPEGTPLNVTLVASPNILASPVLSNIWAFVTVTNNETQHITTITPQPSR